MEYGFVKICSGKAKGRIGRFVGYDEKGVKAKVAFSYDTDIIPYSNYQYFSMNSITKDINKQDLVDRYFEISQALKVIDLRGHREIKKYSAKHTSLITEFNLVCFLLKQIFDVKNLKAKYSDQNIVIFDNEYDKLWLYEFALDLEIKGYSVAIIDYEFEFDNQSLFDYYLQLANHFIFFHRFVKNDYDYLKERVNSSFQTISIINNEQQVASQYYFGKTFSPSYEASLNQLIYDFDNI